MVTTFNAPLFLSPSLRSEKWLCVNFKRKTQTSSSFLRLSYLEPFLFQNCIFPSTFPSSHLDRRPRTPPPLHGRVDHVWFSDDEDDGSLSPTRAKQGEAQTQAAIWLAKDKERSSKAKAAAAAGATSAAGGAAAAPPVPALPLALKNACQIEINRLRASFERVARVEEEEKEGEASSLFSRGVEEGGGNRMTGLAVTLHGGGSLAWEQRCVRLSWLKCILSAPTSSLFAML